MALTPDEEVAGASLDGSGRDLLTYTTDPEARRAQAERIAAVVPLLRYHEGWRAEVYLCTGGAHTVGYGHNLDAGGFPLPAACWLAADDVMAAWTFASQSIARTPERLAAWGGARHGSRVSALAWVAYSIHDTDTPGHDVEDWLWGGADKSALIDPWSVNEIRKWRRVVPEPWPGAKLSEALIGIVGDAVERLCIIEEPPDPAMVQTNTPDETAWRRLLRDTAAVVVAAGHVDMPAAVQDWMRAWDTGPDSHRMALPWSEGHGLGLSDQRERITRRAGASLLCYDLADADAEVLRRWPWYADLPAKAAEGLLNMAFNLGLPRLGKFRKMLIGLEGLAGHGAGHGFGRAAGVEALDSRWAKQVGKRADEIAAMYARFD